jgi:hypothetical protein
VSSLRVGSWTDSGLGIDSVGVVKGQKKQDVGSAAKRMVKVVILCVIWGFFQESKGSPHHYLYEAEISSWTKITQIGWEWRHKVKIQVVFIK